MVFTKLLLFKGLCSTAACTGVGCLGFKYRNDLGGLIDDFVGSKSLYRKAGLICSNGICQLEEGKKITIKHENIEKGELTKENLSSGQGKLKIRVDLFGGYRGNIKFVVESGDISFGSASEKLEEMETYELTWRRDPQAEKGRKYILSRKSTAQKEIKKALGLPCDISNTGTLMCQINDQEKLKTIKFEGKSSSGADVTGFNAPLKLMVSKVSDTSTFPLGYKFVFDSRSDIKFSGTSVVLNKNIDFRIKKKFSNNGSIFLFLERSWSITELIGKVGLEGCTTHDGICSITSQKLNVKQGTLKETNKSSESSSSSGKIRLYMGEDGYREGFKFVVEEGDITIQNGGQITKLEELETYQIEEEGGTYYLSRKKDREKTIRDSLVIPSSCYLPPTDKNYDLCEIETEDRLKLINFEGKTEGQNITSFSKPLKLRIHKENDTSSYPFGYKFVFDPEGATNNEITISGGTSTITLSKSKDYKIKKKKGDKVTLEVKS